MSITLNEQQMNLLREYHEKDVEFQAAKAAMDGADFMSKDFDCSANEFSRTNHNRMNAATVFASSVVGDLQHGDTESTEVSTEPGEIMEAGFADGSNPVSRYAAIDDIVYRYENTEEYNSLSAIEAVARIVHGEVANG